MSGIEQMEGMAASALHEMETKGAAAAAGAAGSLAAMAPGLLGAVATEVMKQINAGAEFVGVAHFDEANGFLHQDMDYDVKFELVGGHPRISKFHFSRSVK